MPPKTRTSIPGERHHRRRGTMDRERRRETAAERAERMPKNEAYKRNKRNAEKASLRRTNWLDW
jgi:hypothetical protein